ncbi:protein PSK SIMULATOR 1-like [Diospyros lotus]|uniref:protein PSK SIMULATOR 1-like n=1 Tax=Diospyros lotus TaxID=55363 RepID=UPI0022525574|nr:protein PSK SIMULATOR 1-like [Diospyros lotus]
MDCDTVTEPWFSNLWRTSHKGVGPDSGNAVIGILAFEVASFMSKLVNLWQCLSDSEIVRLREEILSSSGIRKLVSNDADYLMDLVCAEMIQNIANVAKSVARLGKRCDDPVYHQLEHVLGDPINFDPKWCSWEYRLKKMERKVKKLERFVVVTAELYQELEVLTKLEQNLRTMRGSVGLNRVKLLEIQKKVLWKGREVKSLQEMSPWVRTYDYMVRLLLRSIFTIARRIKHVFGINRWASVEGTSDSELSSADWGVHSYSCRMHTLVHPSENKLSVLSSRHLGRSASDLGRSGENMESKKKKFQAHQQWPLCGKPQSPKTKGLAHAGPFKGCMNGRESPQKGMLMRAGSLRSTGALPNNIDKSKHLNIAPNSCRNFTHPEISLFISKSKLLKTPPFTVGAAALSLHYANIIVLFEKLASSPLLISLDERDKLYNMLPTSVQTSLGAKMKLFSKTSASSVYGADLAVQWNMTLSRILAWLAPLAHNTIKWHSERNFEKPRMVPGRTVLLIQTLHFADQVKTEAAIMELLMGLNYISKFGREIHEKAHLNSAGGKACDNNFLGRDNIVCSV